MTRDGTRKRHLMIVIKIGLPNPSKQISLEIGEGCKEVIEGDFIIVQIEGVVSFVENRAIGKMTAHIGGNHLQGDGLLLEVGLVGGDGLPIFSTCLLPTNRCLDNAQSGIRQKVWSIVDGAHREPAGGQRLSPT